MENPSIGQNWIWICIFLSIKFLEKPLFVDSKNTLFFLVVSQKALLLNRKLILCQVTTMGSNSRNSLGYHGPHHVEAVDLKGSRDGPLQTPLSCQLDDTLQGQSKFFH